MHIYIFKGKSIVLISDCLELRRRIPITKLGGLTVSKDPESSELVIHVINEHDLRIKCNK